MLLFLFMMAHRPEYAPQSVGVRITMVPTDTGDLNSVITDSRLIVGFDDQGRLTLRHPESGSEKIADAGDLSEGRLFAGGAGVFLWRNGAMHRLSMS